jgi:hypothetical protein
MEYSSYRVWTVLEDARRDPFTAHSVDAVINIANLLGSPRPYC